MMRDFLERILAIITGFLIFASYSVGFTKTEQSATNYLITYNNEMNFPLVIGLYLITLALFFKLIPWPKIKALAMFALTLGNLVFFPRLIRQEFRLNDTHLTIVASGYVEAYPWATIQSIIIYERNPSSRAATIRWKITDKAGNIVADQLEHALMEQSREIAEQFATSHGVSFDNQVNP